MCVSDGRRDQGGVSSVLFFYFPSSFFPLSTLGAVICAFQLDKGLGVCAVVDLDVDFGVFFALLFLSAQPPAVAQKITGKAESQHAHDQQPHVNLRRKTQKLEFKFEGDFWFKIVGFVCIAMYICGADCLMIV